MYIPGHVFLLIFFLSLTLFFFFSSFSSFFFFFFSLPASVRAYKTGSVPTIPDNRIPYFIGPWGEGSEGWSPGWLGRTFIHSEVCLLGRTEILPYVLLDMVPFRATVKKAVFCPNQSGSLYRHQNFMIFLLTTRAAFYGMMFISFTDRQNDRPTDIVANRVALP